MSSGLVCPQCRADVDPTWDWCHACGFDPEGLRPDSLPVGAAAGTASAGAPAPPAPLPAPPRGAPTVGLTDGSHPYSGLPYDDTPPELDEPAPKRLGRRERSAPKTVPPPPPPPNGSPASAVPPSLSNAVATGRIIEDPVDVPAPSPYITAPAPAPPPPASEAMSSSIVPASVIGGAAAPAPSIGAEPIDAKAPSFAPPKEKRQTNAGNMAFLFILALVMVGLLAFCAMKLSETADNAAKPRTTTTVNRSGPPPLGAVTAADGTGAAATAAVPETWLPFRSPDGLFSVELPAMPSTTPASLPLTNGDVVVVNRYLAYGNNGVYGVDTFDIPPSFAVTDPNGTMQAVDGLMHKADETVISSGPATVAGRPAWQSVVRTPTGGTRGTTIFVNGNHVTAVYVSHLPEQGDVNLAGADYQHVISTLQLS